MRCPACWEPRSWVAERCPKCTTWHSLIYMWMYNLLIGLLGLGVAAAFFIFVWIIFS